MRRSRSELAYTVAHHRGHIAFLKDAGTTKVRMLAIMDSRTCDFCAEYDDKVYAIDDCPELPLRGCTCEGGCRCSIVMEEMD